VPDSKYQASTGNNADDAEPDADALSSKVKFEIYGEEMIEKRVKSSGNSGRVYLPPNWVGHKVKIIRTD
jgi:putative transposon-encoded protein